MSFLSRIKREFKRSNYSLFLIIIRLILILELNGGAEGRPGSILNNENNEVQQEEEIIYPFQQYIQVRKAYSVEHHPAPAYESSSSSSLYPDEDSSPAPTIRIKTKSKTRKGHRKPSNTGHYENGQLGTYADEHESHNSHTETKPPLREEITDHTKHEVYEEKGSSDSAFDHNSYKGQGHHYPRPSQYQSDTESDNSHNSPEASSTNNRNSYRRDPLYTRLNPQGDGTSTKVLEYAASNLYDRKAHEMGSIYNARDNIYCPEVIDFDLSSKKMAMGQGGNNPRGAKPRLKGLESKIKCLKEKYFGVEPLSPGIFLDPSESRHSQIQMPTYDQFYNSMRKEVRSIFNFQHY